MSRENHSESYEKQEFWQTPWEKDVTKNNILSTEYTLANIISSGLDHDSVEELDEAYKVIIEPPQGTVAMELRFYAVGTADLDDVLQVFAAATTNNKPDFYRHFAQLTIILGTMSFSDTQEFHDDITPANEKWITTPTQVSPGNDTFGSFSFNLHKNNKILVIASDLDNTSIGVQYRIL